MLALVSMMRASPLIVLLALAGCGDAHRRAGPAPADDRKAIGERLTTYAMAAMRGEGETACRQLTPAFRRALDRQAQVHSYAGCADLFRRRPRPQLGEDGRARLFATMRVYIELRQDVATAGLEPARKGHVPKRVTLVRSGREWRINALGTRPL